MSAVSEFLETPEAKFILGLQCFRFIREAELWRATGDDIPTRAEDEQAFFLGHLLGLAAEHGAKWNEVFVAEIKARQSKVPVAAP